MPVRQARGKCRVRRIRANKRPHADRCLRSVSSGARFFPSLRLRLRTFNKLVTGNVRAFLPRFQSSSADCADRVTCMRYQELLFGASVLSTASALHNCHHPDDMCFGSRNFQSGQLSLFSRELAVALLPPVESMDGGKSASGQNAKNSTLANLVRDASVSGLRGRVPPLRRLAKTGMISRLPYSFRAKNAISTSRPADTPLFKLALLQR
jgi:hypothetical protein